ncbi:hypothetical protein SPI_06633 [Niveomyces insectorum RCEF 264]|uniref:Uncharacterized protein n=1 Tax=Niveomyces insectorum RCEF 264 TaxID=1081102 RepID=A0A167RG74_9HYPO|nr:hypothetical protein SPI_06633 [Niveomyces insectorum RCEF 264]
MGKSSKRGPSPPLPPPPSRAPPPPPPPSQAVATRVTALPHTGAAAAAAAAHALPRAATSATAASAASAGGAARSFADQLGRRAAPTRLYEAPSHFWFRASGIAAGAFCIGYTVVNYWSIYLRPPPDLAWWVPHAFGLICVVMAALGGYFVLGGARIIRVIRAVPAAQMASLAGAKPAAKAAVAAAAPSPPPLFLEIEIGRVFPFLSPRKLYVPPSAVALPFRLTEFGLNGETAAVAAPGTGAAAAASAATATAATAVPATGYERVLARRADEERREKAREYEMTHLMTAPFRHAWMGAGVAWRGIRRAFSREGFARVEVDGRYYKLDVTGGWALENGRALDRLVTVGKSF